MNKVLITGANRGIGFETARQLLQKGDYVYIGCIKLEEGIDAVEKLKAEGLNNAEAFEIDVTDELSVKKCREEIGKKTDVLDVLINNAGVLGADPTHTVLQSTPDEYLLAFKVNIIGVANVTKAFVDLLKNAPSARIINVSTSVGSITLQGDPNWYAYSFAKYPVYAASKAALNMLTVQLAYELRDTNIKVNSVCPGLTKTAFTGFNGGEVSVAANRIIKYGLVGDDGPNGKFFSEESNPETIEIPW